jgi:hypothetical protein
LLLQEQIKDIIIIMIRLRLAPPTTADAAALPDAASPTENT